MENGQQNRKSHRAVIFCLGASSGILLFLSDYPVHAWPVQTVALLPLLYGLNRHAADSIRSSVALGLWTGFFYAAPLLLILRFPALMGVGLGLYQTALWIVFSLGVFLVRRTPSPLGALGTGAIAVVLEWVNFSVVPIWGTAQCFARVWSAAPFVIQIVSLTGMTGLVFLLVSSQALAVDLAMRPGKRIRLAVTLGVLIAAALVMNALSWRFSPDRSIRVAAMGWTSEDLDEMRERSPIGVSPNFYEVLLERAVERGARLVVSPEVGFFVPEGRRDQILAYWGGLAGEHGVWLVVGFFDEARNDNRIAFIDDTGKTRAEYAKTHLIPFFERYEGGDGKPVVLRMDGLCLGGMICQDDNFTDLARASGRRGVQVMAVPTNDWKQVKDYHLENAIFRGVENRYGIVRAASNGISAIVSPRGEVLARKNHFEEGPGVLVADLPVGVGGTPYSHGGDWFALACLVFLAVVILARRARKPSGDLTAPT